MLQVPYVRRVLSKSLEMGWTIIGVNNGEELVSNFKGLTIAEAIRHARATDESHVILQKDGKRGVLFIVWQGPVKSYPYGEEAINDYSLSLEPVIDAVPV